MTILVLGQIMHNSLIKLPCNSSLEGSTLTFTLLGSKTTKTSLETVLLVVIPGEKAELVVLTWPQV